MTREFVCGIAAALALGCVHTRAARPVPLRVAAAPLPVEDGLRWVADAAARARTVGALAPSMVATGAGAPGDNLGGRAFVPTGDCALFLARGGRSVEDLDLFVYGDDGSVLAEDETSSPTASVMLCPPHPEHVYAFGRVAAGHGLFTVSEQLVPQRDADPVTRAVGAVGEFHEEAASDSGWPQLDSLVEAHRRELGGTFHDVRRVAVPLDPRVPTRVSVPVEANQCMDVLVVPGQDVAFVELTALDAKGRILGRAPMDASDPAAVVCVAAQEELSFELRARAGRGLAAVVMSTVEDRKSLDAPGTVILSDSQVSPKLEDARKQLASELAKAGYPAPMLEKTGASRSGRHVSLDVELPEGCSRLDVLGGAPSLGVEAWLWSASGALLAHDDGTVGATVFGCGAGHARMDLEALTHDGPFALTVRRAPGTTAALTEHPLAGGRVLGRLSSAKRIATPRDVITHAVTLTTSSLATEVTSVPANRCLDVALGLGPGAEGAELRLVAADGGTELDFVRGTYSALASACATEGSAPLRIRLEMRVAAGTTTALVATHVRTTASSRSSATSAGSGAPVARVDAH